MSVDLMEWSLSLRWGGSFIVMLLDLFLLMPEWVKWVVL